MQATRRSGQVFSRVVVPLVLFLVVVAVIAYVVQNINMRGPVADDSNQAAMQRMLVFDFLNAPWDPDNVDYVKEFEPGHEEEGKFDFPFQNATKTELEVGLDQSSCNCTRVRIALVPAGSEPSVEPTWLDLKAADGKSDRQILLVPVGGRGKVRLVWKEPEKEVNDYVKKNLTATLWVQPKGSGEQSRKVQVLSVHIKLVPKVQFQDNVHLGEFPDRASNKDSPLICWSATRDINDAKNSIKIDESRVPAGFKFEIAPYDIKKLQKELDASKPPVNTKVMSAVSIAVEVAAAKLPFDGPFAAVKIPLLLEGKSYKEGPSVYGSVQPSIVIVGNVNGTIPFSRNQEYRVLPDPGQTMLTILRAPEIMDASLMTYDDEGNQRWKLKLAIPRGAGLPQDSVIVIRSQPTPYYHDDVMSLASALGNTAAAFGMTQIGSLPGTGNLANLANSWGLGARLTRVPVVGSR